MVPTFKFLAGSLAIEEKPFHLKAAERLKAAYSKCDGYIAYRLTTLGRASEEDIPSFIVITREHGIILIDIIEEKVTDTLEEDGAEFWIVDEVHSVKARNLVVEIYEEEVISRLKNDLSLYDRKAKQCRVELPLKFSLPQVT